MTDGERAIWAAAFTRRLLDRAKPSDHATSSAEAYAAWLREVNVDAAGCAADVVTRARATLACELRPVAADMLREMLGAPSERVCAGDAACGGGCSVCRANERRDDATHDQHGNRRE